METHDGEMRFCREPAPALPVVDGWLAVTGWMSETAFCCRPCANQRHGDWLLIVGYALEVPRAGEPQRRPLAAALKSLRNG